MTPIKLNYCCRVYQPVNNAVGASEKYRFDICFRDDLFFTDGKEYDSVSDCTSALCTFINKLSEYHKRKYNFPIIIDSFEYFKF